MVSLHEKWTLLEQLEKLEFISGNKKCHLKSLVQELWYFYTWKETAFNIRLVYLFSLTECEKDTYGDKRYITGCKKCPENSYTVHQPGYPAKSIKDCKCKKGYEGNPGIGIPCKREYVFKCISSFILFWNLPSIWDIKPTLCRYLDESSHYYCNNVYFYDVCFSWKQLMMISVFSS